MLLSSCSQPCDLIFAPLCFAEQEDETHIQSSLAPSTVTKQEVEHHEMLSSLDNYYRLP